MVSSFNLFFIFTPIWRRFSNLTGIFFRWVETTKQVMSITVLPLICALNCCWRDLDFRGKDTWNQQDVDFNCLTLVKDRDLTSWWNWINCGWFTSFWCQDLINNFWWQTWRKRVYSTKAEKTENTRKSIQIISDLHENADPPFVAGQFSPFLLVGLAVWPRLQQWVRRFSFIWRLGLAPEELTFRTPKMKVWNMNLLPKNLVIFSKPS